MLGDLEHRDITCLLVVGSPLSNLLIGVTMCDSKWQLDAHDKQIPQMSLERARKEFQPSARDI